MAEFAKKANFHDFVNSEVKKNDLEGLFVRVFKNFSGKNLNLQVKICFAKGNLH